MKPKVLVINTPHSTKRLTYSYKYNLYFAPTCDIYSDNLRILLKIFKLRGSVGIFLASTTDQWKLIQDYYR